MSNKKRSEYTVTKDNFMLVVRKIITRNLEGLWHIDPDKYGDLTTDSVIEQEIECSEHRIDRRNSTEWLDAISSFFNGDRRTFIDMELWVFGIFSDEYLCSSYEEAHELHNRLFLSFEEIQRLDDRRSEELQFIATHFGGSVLKYLNAGGSRYMRAWKKSNSGIQLPTSEDRC